MNRDRSLSDLRLAIGDPHLQVGARDANRSSETQCGDLPRSEELVGLGAPEPQFPGHVVRGEEQRRDVGQPDIVIVSCANSRGRDVVGSSATKRQLLVGLAGG